MIIWRHRLHFITILCHQLGNSCLVRVGSLKNYIVKNRICRLNTSMRRSSMCTLSKGIVLRTSSSDPSISRLMKSTLIKKYIQQISTNLFLQSFLPWVSQGKKEAVQGEALDNNSFSCNICQQGMKNLLANILLGYLCVWTGAGICSEAKHW